LDRRTGIYLPLLYYLAALFNKKKISVPETKTLAMLTSINEFN